MTDPIITFLLVIITAAVAAGILLALVYRLAKWIDPKGRE
jgi:archaellum component FlaG (FlaF/FlaG flagellin family)